MPVALNGEGLSGLTPTTLNKMDMLKLEKAFIDSNPDFSPEGKLLLKFAANTQLADPIDREAETLCDLADYRCEVACNFLKANFSDQDMAKFGIGFFHGAAEDEKIRILQQAELAKWQRCG